MFKCLSMIGVSVEWMKGYMKILKNFDVDFFRVGTRSVRASRGGVEVFKVVVVKCGVVMVKNFSLVFNVSVMKNVSVC